MNLKKIVMLGGLTMLFGLTSCEGPSKKRTNSSWIYQPRILLLEQGIVIQTKEGQYKVQNKEEVWHSDRAYRELEEKIIFKY